VELVTTLKEEVAFPTTQASKTSNEDEEKGKEATLRPDVVQAARLILKSVASSVDETTCTFISRLSRTSTKAIATMGLPP